MFRLWDKDWERDFFVRSLELAKPEKLFYTTREGRFYAYWPKGYQGPKSTLQSRNAFVGTYTEKWVVELVDEIRETIGAHAVQGAICEEIGLTKVSRADVAICRRAGIVQKPQDILMVIEVKMSIVWNWEYLPKAEGDFDLLCVGDYMKHQGNPGLLRSDTMLKAIGKSINIRVSGSCASSIPIVVIGNTPITRNYYDKVDHLRRSGIIQGFWSVNPRPLDGDGRDIKRTEGGGFYRLDHYNELKQNALELLGEDKHFFSSMCSTRHLGQIVEIANRERTYEAKGQRFLELLKNAQ